MIPRKAFDPRSLQFIALWLDASDQPEAGAWRDKSGNGRHATQVATNNQPALVQNVIASRPALDFDGINDSLAIASFSLSAWTAFAAVQPTVATQRTVLHVPSSSSESFNLTTSSTARQVVSSSGVAQPATSFLGADVRVGARWDGGALKSHFGGSLFEIVVYSRALTLEESDAVTRYLRQKWNAT